LLWVHCRSRIKLWWNYSIIMETNKLIIFVKNPIQGKVKTRLAAEIGEAPALEIYKTLLKHTHQVATNTQEVSISVYYADFVNNNDLWNNFDKKLQEQQDLGSRMNHAIKSEMENGFQNIIIIGSDCLEINPQHIQKAFLSLKTNDIVIGPAEDGGYYLIGLKSLIPDIFKNKKWSTDTVFIDTIEDINRLNLKHMILETLCDIDTKKDLDRYKITIE